MPAYTFEQSKDEIAQLVRHFHTNQAAFLATAYKEARARQELIDPLFVALNWDVHNAQRAAPDYREVIIEDTLEIAGQKKAPDYAFRLGRERKFFAEAKKPGVDLKDDPLPAYQLRRYAWSAKLPLSLLTDFQELAVYDCRLRPAAKDKAGVARVQYLRAEEYPDRWREVWDVFSRDAVYGGAFDQFAVAGRGKRGASEVDAEFLKEIETWREALARNLALRNPRLTVDQLNDAVQRTIDRLIFLRMAEDRGIEEYGRLQRLAEGGDIYAGLLALARQADAKYNSGLFDFSKAGDRVTPGLTVDDKALRPILNALYFPQSPYEFSVMPAEILGNVYEQFLGKVIRLTAGHQAKVEAKPEVKKAGGVFYTPAYIVAYIVQSTVGVAVAGKSPAQLKGFTVLDPACGSGSFLLGAYTFLLDYYLAWYTAHEPEKHPAAVAQADGLWRLTLAERKRILTEHIFGVDLDRQAVEVTKLSLLLKVLEGVQQLTLFAERALPSLERNIKCGNSLIGPDFFDGQLLPDPEAMRRVNAFDWAAEFPAVFQRPARKLWFVTFVTHNARVSERMVTYGVEAGEPLVFSPEDQVFIAREILETCRRERIAVVAANFLPDHVHLVLAAEDERALDEQVRKIKGASSFAYQRAHGWELAGQQHVWAQKFNRVAIADEAALTNIVAYVSNNHLKHTERWGEALAETWDKGLKPLVQAACVSVAEACQPQGGFDCIVGNPPYIRIQTMTEWAPLEVEAYKRLYQSASAGNYDIYVVFVEKGLSLLNPAGRLGFILPHKFFNAKYGAPLRGLIAQGQHLAEVVHFGDQQVFAGATTYTCLLFLTRAPAAECHMIKVADLAAFREQSLAGRAPGIGETRGLSPLSSLTATIPAGRITAAEWNFSTGASAALLDKLRQMPVKLGAVASKIFQGLVTSADPIYFLEPVSGEKRGMVRVLSKATEKEYELESFIAKPLCKGSRDVRRYLAQPSKRVIFPYDAELSATTGKTVLISAKDFARNYPQGWKYLNENIGALRDREKGKMRVEGWYGYVYPKSVALFARPKLLTPSIAARASFTYDKAGELYFAGSGGGGGGGYGIILKDGIQLAYEYLLGLLNSRLLDYYLQQTSSPFSGGYYAYSRQYIEHLPIRTIDFSDPADKARHDKLVGLVEKMLDLHQRKAAAEDAGEQTRLQRLIDATDKQIDALVYELYELTPEEIALVEGQGA